MGDKWTMLVVRDLARGPRRTTELIEALHPISSRTLVDRLRDMERDELVERRDRGGSPPHVEYLLTERGLRLLPLLEALRAAGEALDCNACDDRLSRHDDYCDACPRRAPHRSDHAMRRPRTEDNIVLL
jgi:DNA-binding HxlR family transcriptional regulator